MTQNRVENVVLENVKIIFRNFAGNQTQYNPAGRRTFSVLLSERKADELASLGWNVKPLRPREEDDELMFHLPVRVMFGNYPPDIYLVTSGNRKTRLNEDTIATLDFAEIANVDLIVRPYQWEMNGKEGVTAYAKTMYVTVVEDAFAGKYAEDYPDEIPFN